MTKYTVSRVSTKNIIFASLDTGQNLLVTDSTADSPVDDLRIIIFQWLEVGRYQKENSQILFGEESETTEESD